MATTTKTRKRTEEPPRALLSLEEAARQLGLDKVSVSAARAKVNVLQMVARRELVGVKVGRWMMIDPASLDRFLGRC